jgi:hypothetical protein
LNWLQECSAVYVASQWLEELLELMALRMHPQFSTHHPDALLRSLAPMSVQGSWLGFPLLVDWSMYRTVM